MIGKLRKLIVNWLVEEFPPSSTPLCDFERLKYEIKPCDVILVEGRSRISEVIKQITQSSWSHAMLYIGRLYDIENEALREHVKHHFKGDPSTQLVIESYLGQGTIVTPLEDYHKDHLRICRPKGISMHDARHVIGYAIGKIGTNYDVRQIFDLFRLLLPWGIMPRRWRSSLFVKKKSTEFRTICSSVIAEAFGQVRFPILPVLQMKDHTRIELVPRNPRLMTPKDFDYSPYFEIIKYPFITMDSVNDAPYQRLPWTEEEKHHHGDEHANFCPVSFPEDPAKHLEDLQKESEPEIKPEDEQDKEPQRIAAKATVSKETQE